MDRVRIDLTIQSEKGLQFDLCLTGCKRVFKLKAQSKEQFEEWTQTLKIAIERSNGFKNNLSINTKDFSLDFWRYDMIDEKSFLDNAETGDLLLFRGKHIINKV